MFQYGFYFDREKCVECHSCEVACQLWNADEQTVKWRRAIGRERGSFPNVKRINLSFSCMHCANPPCRNACPREAITKSADTGVVTVDQKKCVGCMLCLWACPFGAPKMGVQGKMEKCTFCKDRPAQMKRACEEICPTQAIVSGPVDELAKMAAEEMAKQPLSAPSSGVILGHDEV
jgi:Fe-S-cluster-containing dehydrogenase component